jgi:putative membrane protein
MIPPDDRFDAQPNVGNHFAWMRTQMGLQRTLLAAVRTAVSLIGFGFTVAQFFEKLVGNAARAGAGHGLGPDAPRNLGLVLIAAGVISLAVFTWQYREVTNYLRAGDFAQIAARSGASMHSSTYLVSGTVMLIGVAAFLSVFMRF